MVPTNLNFWSISRNENLECQQKHALRKKFLPILLCSNDIFISGYNRKTLMGKRTSNRRGVCFIDEQMFHSVQCTACGICQCSSREKFVLPEATCTVSFLDRFHYL